MQIESRHTIELGCELPVEAVRTAFAEARRTVLVAHTNADGDAVGSVTGMYAVLRKMTSSLLTPMLPDGCPDDLRWLPNTGAILSGQSDYEACLKAIEEADTVVAVDLNNLDRTGRLAEAFAQSKARKLLFDHHEGPDREAFDIVVSDPEISSTCELIYWSMREVFGPEAFDLDSATSLYTGICTDTGTFSYSNTLPGVYTAAAELLHYGIDPMAINREIKNVFTPQRLQFFGYAISQRLTIYPEQQVALMVLRKSDMESYCVESHELTGLINEVMRLHDTDCGILIREEDGKVRLSLRSKTRYDVNRLAGELFGGGGHVRAAGATSLLTLDETVETVKRRLAL